jgi:hypothetical protein
MALIEVLACWLRLSTAAWGIVTAAAGLSVGIGWALEVEGGLASSGANAPVFR